MLPLTWLGAMQETSRVCVWVPGLGNRNLGSRSRLNKGFEEAFAVAAYLISTAFVGTEKLSRDHNPG